MRGAAEQIWITTAMVRIAGAASTAMNSGRTAIGLRRCSLLVAAMTAFSNISSGYRTVCLTMAAGSSQPNVLGVRM